VLLSIAAAYREKHGEVLEQAQMVESAISRAESSSTGGGKVSAAVIDAILESARKMFDAANGGFGNAPKFPHPAALDLVMEQYAQESGQSGDEELHTIFVRTLEKMACGGVYDQLAGGFHRYSVDERWIVPHFEKMCYDNSELLKNYIHAYQVTQDSFFAGVARDIIRWMDEWLSDRAHGGFYASQDADYSMDDDGDYFTWTLEETKAALTPEEEAVAALYYGIQEVGDMHHNRAKNVLHVQDSDRQSAVGQEDVCGATAAADAVCGQNGLRGLERHVRFRLSGSGQGAGSGGGAPICFALARPTAFRGLERGTRDETCHRLLRSESCETGNFWRAG
jgi:uncharacterized protein YyaL (SSP411 family)